MMDSNKLKIWLQEVLTEAINGKHRVDEAQILPEGSLALLLDDGTLIRVRLNVDVQPPSQLSKTEIM